MKLEQDLLKQANDIVSQCDRCGTCLTVCPLFGVKDIEASSARGKNNIIRGLMQGVLKPSPALTAAVNFCLLCRTCVDNCPSKVKTDEAMIAVRQYLADKGGGPGLKYKTLGGIMKNRNLVKMSARALGFMRKVGMNRLVPNGMAPSEFTRQKYLASFAGPAVLGSPAANSSVSVSAKNKAAYFLGCGMHMMFPDAVAETKRILCTVSEPQFVDNVCCGLPHLAHGLRNDFLDLAKKNIRLYENAEVIVCDCASCSGTLKHIAGFFADDPVWKDRAAAFSNKVMDLSEYLVNVGYTPRQRVDAKITFHEPCHLGRGQGIRREPRDLLKATGNYIEMKDADTCCGGAGSFHIDYPAVSDSLLSKKQVNIENSGAHIVVTSCPTCLVQMNKAAARSGGKFRAMHISQVI
ncbi:MAG TPA: (Fe-S)-binding protein [Methylomusa anaerophila]|uniref:Glycolate oxidase iron-sulfur subunit n=1 Tax=Methylomusa anaerophila TaxID=1930071 RepID=A0A348AFW6_9FIRM|nr:(Fe-S)-binding protein [Methylomusa anaerophila]BBB89964.1 lactate utilization protein A [Methylomusa anaerophila]HML88309.1 (Fe-S)-binding protein [Methylomusa anaerophila]